MREATPDYMFEGVRIARHDWNLLMLVAEAQSRQLARPIVINEVLASLVALACVAIRDVQAGPVPYCPQCPQNTNITPLRPDAGSH